MNQTQRLMLGILSLTALAATLAAPAAAQPVPVEINAILSTTGSAAFLGSKELQALQILEGVVNKTGGINGRPVHFVVADDASNPQTGVQLANGLIAKGVPAIIGSSVLATCGAIDALTAAAGPVTYCLSPLAKPVAGSYIYSTSIAGNDFVPVLTKFLHAKGWKRVAMINSIDATGQDMEREFVNASKLQGQDLTIVSNEHFAPGDISVTAQMSRIKEQKPQVVLAFATGPAFATIMHSIQDAGLDMPIVGSGGNMNYAQLEQYNSFLPKTLLFLAGGGVVADPTITGKQKDAQTTYLNAYKAAGVRPEYAATLVWDPALLIVDALRHVGPSPTSKSVNDYLQGLSNWAGIAGIYDFKAAPQRGLGQSGTVIYRWDTEQKALFTVPIPRT
jgi:branched-chain amino acid transport system substrate-binding protein